MSDVKEAVQALYRSDPDREWQRLDRHRTEFAVTLQALDDHLPPPPADILDCGGGPGRYAITLTKKGHRVTLFDLSSELLDLARRHADTADVTLAGYEQGTATDLSRFADDSFDAVLLMGPLYHLLKEADRHQALAEAYRVVKPGGTVIAAFISRYANHLQAVAHYPEQASQQPEVYHHIAKTGLLPPRADETGGFVAYLAHPYEVAPLCRQAGLDVITVLGVEGVVSGHEERINALEGEAWDFWVDVNYQIAHDPSTHGGAEHLLAVCRKPRWRSALRHLAAQLQAANIQYSVVGGTSLALRGLPVPVNDIDLEMSAQDAYRFGERFADRALQPVAWQETPTVRSHFGRYEIDNVIFEVMADLERRTADGRWAPSFNTTQVVVDLDGFPISVPTLEEEALAYLRQGRLDRASLVLAHCDPDTLRRALQHALARGML